MNTYTIDQEITALERYIAITQKRLKRTINGYIRIRNNKGKTELKAVYYDEQHNKKEKYLNKNDTRTISMLCGEKYYKKLLPVLEDELKALRKFKESYQPMEKYDVYGHLPAELQQYVSPVVKTPRQIAEDWAQDDYPRNEYEFDFNTKYETRKGDRVRSRMECIFADMLWHYGIPYRYECRLELQSGRVVYPDFTIMHPETGELYYVELFGMMDDPDYAASNWEKISRYSCDPVFSHLFMFFDTAAAPFGTDQIENFIRTLFR